MIHPSAHSVSFVSALCIIECVIFFSYFNIIPILVFSYVLVGELCGRVPCPFSPTLGCLLRLWIPSSGCSILVDIYITQHAKRQQCLSPKRTTVNLDWMPRSSNYPKLIHLTTWAGHNSWSSVPFVCVSTGPTKSHDQTRTLPQPYEAPGLPIEREEQGTQCLKPV